MFVLAIVDPHVVAVCELMSRDIDGQAGPRACVAAACMCTHARGLNALQCATLRC